MTHREQPPLMAAMTTDTASVFIATELVRIALDRDGEGLYRAVAEAMSNGPEITSRVVANLASITGVLLTGSVPHATHEFLDRLLIRAQFHQIVDC